MMKRIIPVFLLLCLLLAACGTGGGGAIQTHGPDEPNAPANANAVFSLYPAYLILPLGQHLTLEANDAPAGKLVWTSSDTSVATVDGNGRITPIKAGVTIITAALERNAGINAACGVLVAEDGNIFLWEE